MPIAGRFLAAALTLASAAPFAAHAAEPAQDPLTTPSSPLYQPDAGVRTQVRDVMANPPAATPSAPLPELGPNIPVPRGLVAVAQRELTAQGYDPGPVDGRMGPMTRKALMAFQTDKGLTADGQLTFALLDKLMVRAAPETKAAPPPPPPPPPPVQWSARRTLGKSVHALAGDLLGTVADFVVSADRRSVVGVVVETTNGYGTDHGRVLVPFDQVGRAIGYAVVILSLPAATALPLRDKAHEVTLSDGQWLLGTALTEGDSDATADSDGHLLSLPSAR